MVHISGLLEIAKIPKEEKTPVFLLPQSKTDFVGKMNQDVPALKGHDHLFVASSVSGLFMNNRNKSKRTIKSDKGFYILNIQYYLASLNQNFIL